MNTIVRLMLVSMLMVVAAPAFSDSVMEAFHCTEAEGTNEEQVEAIASEWLKAAKGMKGGDQMEVYLHFPVVGALGGDDFLFVVAAPNLEAWGAFWDGYPDSPAENVDEKFDALVDCADSTLYESVRIE